MRVPIYRNLDSPFRIGGFKPLELVIVCALFVGLSEVSSWFELNRVWAVLVAVAVGGSLFWMRRSLGDEFAQRLIRFSGLPRQLFPRPFRSKRRL